MVLAHHLIFGAYGFWLPNDPRGSWSDMVAAWELRRFGPATTTSKRRSHAYDPHNRDARLRAKEKLKYPAVLFDGAQAQAIGEGFADFIRKNGLVVWVCAILPEHVHLVIARHNVFIESRTVSCRASLRDCG